MNATTTPSNATDPAATRRTHRCPWWLHYLLASPLRRMLESPRRILGPHVAPGMTVLDVGCGFGYASLPLARMVGPEGRVISVDVEPRVVAKLERRARRAGLARRIDARACDAAGLGLGEYAGQVDLVTVIHTLHEIADPSAFLEQIAALLAPGGRLLVVEPRGHVEPERLAAQVALCRSLGFAELAAPKVGRGRMAALFAAPGA